MSTGAEGSGDQAHVGTVRARRRIEFLPASFPHRRPGALTRREVIMVNKLAAEVSPYLLQHAENPVQWFPWGDEAFEEARRRDVPIFLSVGYSSCHWRP